jgi:hypothetical protein
LVVAGTLSQSHLARAVDNACFDAYEQSQRLRNNGKLVEARAQTAICAREECPSALKRDCAQWSTEIDRTVATVVFAAKDDKGQDTTVTGVYVDDRKVADVIDGKPVKLDPGAHKVRFEKVDQKVEFIVELSAGETNHRIEHVIAPAPPPPPPAESSAGRHIPRVSLILGGVAAVGLVSFVSFAVAGRVEQGCSPLCNSSQIGTLRAEYAVADVSWITGLAALGGAIGFWYFQPAAPAASAQGAPTATLHFDMGPARGGGTIGLHGTF